MSMTYMTPAPPISLNEITRTLAVATERAWRDWIAQLTKQP